LQILNLDITKLLCFFICYHNVIKFWSQGTKHLVYNNLLIHGFSTILHLIGECHQSCEVVSYFLNTFHLRHLILPSQVLHPRHSSNLLIQHFSQTLCINTLVNEK
jgi:hypothetical protein